MIKKILILISIIIVCFVGYYNFSNEIIINDNQIKLLKNKTGIYKIILFSSDKIKICDMNFPKEPWIKNITDEIDEIGISMGSPSKYVFYFNKNSNEISEVFFNSILLDDGLIAYMTNNVLIISDVFTPHKIYKKITRDFTRTANPISAIYDIKLINDKTINLYYYSGENYLEKNEVILIQ